MKIRFEGYGELEYIEPHDYYTGGGDYRYIEAINDSEDDESYDIVYSNVRMSYYCTQI